MADAYRVRYCGAEEYISIEKQTWVEGSVPRILRWELEAIALDEDQARDYCITLPPDSTIHWELS